MEGEGMYSALQDIAFTILISDSWLICGMKRQTDADLVGIQSFSLLKENTAILSKNNLLLEENNKLLKEIVEMLRKISINTS
jgi:hypothetical protein